MTQPNPQFPLSLQDISMFLSFEKEVYMIWSAIAASLAAIFALVNLLKNLIYFSRREQPSMSFNKYILIKQKEKQKAMIIFQFMNSGGGASRLTKIEGDFFHIPEGKRIEDICHPILILAPNAIHSHNIPFEVKGELSNVILFILYTLYYSSAKNKRKKFSNSFAWIFKNSTLTTLTEEDLKAYRDKLSEDYYIKLQQRLQK